MADEWRVGDLALCVAAHPKYPAEVQPGAVLTVEYIWNSTDIEDQSHRDRCFDFVGIDRIDGDVAYWCGNFRKIHPHTPDAEDAETIRLLNGVPVLEPATPIARRAE